MTQGSRVYVAGCTYPHHTLLPNASRTACAMATVASVCAVPRFARDPRARSIVYFMTNGEHKLKSLFAFVPLTLAAVVTAHLRLDFAARTMGNAHPETGAQAPDNIKMRGSLQVLVWCWWRARAGWRSHNHCCPSLPCCCVCTGGCRSLCATQKQSVNIKAWRDRCVYLDASLLLETNCAGCRTWRCRGPCWLHNLRSQLPEPAIRPRQVLRARAAPAARV